IAIIATTAKIAKIDTPVLAANCSSNSPKPLQRTPACNSGLNFGNYGNFGNDSPHRSSPHNYSSSGCLPTHPNQIVLLSRRQYRDQQEVHMKRLVTLLILVICIIAVAQERFDIKVREYFFSGFTGNTAALDKGMKMCEEALAANPKFPEAMVWHGSGLVYRA